MPFTDPGLVLQRAIVQALLADRDVAALVDKGVYDQVPRAGNGDPGVPFPYLTFGEVQMLPELGEATDAAESFVTLHAWSRKVGFPEVKALAAAVVARLHDATLTLTNGSMQSLLLQNSHFVRDPDGLTSHAIMTFQILTDAN